MENDGKRQANEVIEQSKSLPPDYNYHLDRDNGLYKNVTSTDAMPLEEEIKDKINRYVLSDKRKTYAFNPDYNCKVVGSFNIEGDNLSDLHADITFDTSDNFGESIEAISLKAQGSGKYIFDITLFLGKTHGILKYEDLKIKLATDEKTERAFNDVEASKQLLNDNNQKRNADEFIEYKKFEAEHQGIIAAAAATAAADAAAKEAAERKKAEAEAEAARLAEELRKQKEAEAAEEAIKDKIEADMGLASIKLLGVLDDAIKGKMENQDGNTEAKQDELRSTGENFTELKKYWIDETDKALTKSGLKEYKIRQFNKFKEEIEQAMDIDSIEKIIKKYKKSPTFLIKRNGVPDGEEKTKPEHPYSPFFGGSRRTLKRGGKKTRRKTKRSQRRRSGRRGKRTSRR